MTCRKAEGGFTLTELLVTIVVMSIIMFGITTGLIVVLHTYPADATRLTQDEGAQLLSSWLQGDVLSAGPNNSNIDKNSATTSGCAGVAASTNVLKLTWSDFDTSITFEASYRLAGSILTRYSCVNAGSAAVTEVGRNVQSAMATVSAEHVSLVVTDLVGGSTYTFTVSASRRTLAPPAATTSLPLSTTTTSSTTTTTTTIPPTTTTSTTVVGTTTTTSSTTTTTMPVCTIVSGTASPSSDQRANGNSGHLTQDLTITVVTTGPCAPLNYSVNTGTGVQNQALAQNGSTWTAPIGKNTFSWTDGSHPFTILQAGTPPTVVPGSPNPILFSVT